MSVESFDPGAPQAALAPLNAATLERLLEASAESPPDFGLTQAERSQFAGLAGHSGADWATAVDAMDATAVEALIRFFTLAEETINGWQADAKSPVIALVRVLKGRGAYPSELTSWIKSNTSNRFLPYGSLMDRL